MDSLKVQVHVLSVQIIAQNVTQIHLDVQQVTAKKVSVSFDLQDFATNVPSNIALNATQT